MKLSIACLSDNTYIGTIFMYFVNFFLRRQLLDGLSFNNSYAGRFIDYSSNTLKEHYCG